MNHTHTILGSPLRSNRAHASASPLPSGSGRLTVLPVADARCRQGQFAPLRRAAAQVFAIWASGTAGSERQVAARCEWAGSVAEYYSQGVQ
jgi:hypothetical protein